MQSTQFFSGSTYKICVSYEAFFPLNNENAYDHQTFQGDDMLQGAFTHTYMHDISTEWSCGVKWQIKYTCHISNTYLQNMYQYHTTQGANFV